MARRTRARKIPRLLETGMARNAIARALPALSYEQAHEVLEFVEARYRTGSLSPVLAALARNLARVARQAGDGGRGCRPHRLPLDGNQDGGDEVHVQVHGADGLGGRVVQRRSTDNGTARGRGRGAARSCAQYATCSRSAPLPSSRILAAHFATVALLHPNERAVSFQLTPFSSCPMISSLVTMSAPFHSGEGVRTAPSSLKGYLSGPRYRLRRTSVLGERNVGTT